MQKIELLSPARNAEIGFAAINHGADAVYIGADKFGARAAAGNSVQDIEKLVKYAHRYNARIFTTLNTIFNDDEIVEAEKLAWDLYRAGVDALIVQDLGLVKCNLPPMEIHASTQTDNRTPQKVQFLESLGFSQVVLARELTMTQIKAIKEQTTAALEFFIHGALCVAYSGRCYISQAFTGRSANRGECAQFCRLPYTLEDKNGIQIAESAHWLSIRDLNLTENLSALIDAGISSFKIEGRLKDIGYVKNITAHYRQTLDGILAGTPGLVKSSSGKCTYFFEPNPNKSFNRGFTTYFVQDRQPNVLQRATPKSTGEVFGRTIKVAENYLQVQSTAQSVNGDGFCFLDNNGKLVGFKADKVDGNRIYWNNFPKGLQSGTMLYRNFDKGFEDIMQKNSAERKISLNVKLIISKNVVRLEAIDEDQRNSVVYRHIALEPAGNPGGVNQKLHDSLRKAGNSIWYVAEAVLDNEANLFLPASVLGEMKNELLEAHLHTRLINYKTGSKPVIADQPMVYVSDKPAFQENILNSKAAAVMATAGFIVEKEAYETEQVIEDVPLMTTKHCIKYEMQICPRYQKGQAKAEPYWLVTPEGQKLRLVFNCAKCEMEVVGRLKGL